MSKFEPIGPPTDGGVPLSPYDGNDVLVARAMRRALIVRNASWNDGKHRPEMRGWWSPKASGGFEKLKGIDKPTMWAPMPELPDEWQ